MTNEEAREILQYAIDNPYPCGSLGEKETGIAIQALKIAVKALSGEPVGVWEDVPCERDLLNMTGYKYRCPVCGDWNSYGQPPHCMYCGARLEKSELYKELKKKREKSIGKGGAE